MRRRLPIWLLILVVLVPPGAGLASGQAWSGEESTSSEVEGSQPAHCRHPEALTVESKHPGQAMMEAHVHSAAECEQYCMNCSSHCFTSAFGDATVPFPVFSSRFGKPVFGELSDQAELLLRPPIRF